MTPSFNIVVAIDNQNGIGKGGILHWHLPADKLHFKTLTSYKENQAKQNLVIMGRKTWDSLPPYARPLKNRQNLILSRKLTQHPDAIVMHNLADSLQWAHDHLDTIETVYIIGGGQIFIDALQSPHCHKLFVTHIEQDLECDTFFPPFEHDFHQIYRSETLSENNLNFTFCTYKRR